MATFKLQIVTPDGLMFDGEAESLVVRTTEGDVCVLPRHINFVTALGMGEAKIRTPEGERRAACIGGMLSVDNGEVKLVPTTFEWAEDIDAARADRAREEAERRLANRANLSEHQLMMAEAKLHRALVRRSVAGRK